MAIVEVKCPTCGGVQVYKYGKSKNGTQRYLCHASECPTKTFRLEYRYEGEKPGIDKKIITMATNASGIRDTARVLGISTDKVLNLCNELKGTGAGVPLMHMVLKKYNPAYNQEDIIEACYYLQGKELISFKHVRSDALDIERDIAYITPKGIDVLEDTTSIDGIILG